MRVSVLTGLLACTLVFTVSSGKAEAAPMNLLTTNTDELPLTELAVSHNEIAQLVIASNEISTENEPVTAEPEVLKHTVAESETLSDIAKTYETTWTRLYDKNTQIVNPDLINPGDEIVIPANDEVLESRALPTPEPEPVSSVNEAQSNTITRQTPTRAQAVQTQPVSTAGNSYAAGYCTWYVKNRRPDLPNNLGNARTWVSRAAAQGYATGSTPRVGAVGQRNNHVVYVESINADGSVNISEMNFNGGLFQVNYRTLPASSFTYIY